MSPKMSNEEIIITAKTVDEALSKAEAEYGSQGDISYEILEMPKKGFFGIGSAHSQRDKFGSKKCPEAEKHSAAQRRRRPCEESAEAAGDEEECSRARRKGRAAEISG